MKLILPNILPSNLTKVQPSEFVFYLCLWLMVLGVESSCSEACGCNVYVIRDFHNIFIRWSESLKAFFYNAAKKSIILIKFDVDNNIIVILYKKQQKSWHQSNVSLVHL